MQEHLTPLGPEGSPFDALGLSSTLPQCLMEPVRPGPTTGLAPSGGFLVRPADLFRRGRSPRSPGIPSSSGRRNCLTILAENHSH